VPPRHIQPQELCFLLETRYLNAINLQESKLGLEDECSPSDHIRERMCHSLYLLSYAEPSSSPAVMERSGIAVRVKDIVRIVFI